MDEREIQKTAASIAGLLVMTAVCLVLVQFCGCGGPAPAAAEAGYLAQQLKCIDEANSREQADECRARVKAAWAKDAGADR